MDVSFSDKLHATKSFRLLYDYISLELPRYVFRQEIRSKKSEINAPGFLVAILIPSL